MSWDFVTVRLFRSLISRSNIKYHIIIISGKMNKIKEWTQIIQQKTGRYFVEKFVIYCNFRISTEKLAESLKCEHFHNQVQNKNEILQRFRIKKKMIVVINAFGMRIDVSDIRIVFHVDRSHNLLNYAQENERAERNGIKSEVILIIRGSTKRAEKKNQDVMLMKSFIHDLKCKRTVLNKYLDGRNRVECEEDEKACQFCENEAKNYYNNKDSEDDSFETLNQMKSNSDEENLTEEWEIQKQQFEKNSINDIRQVRVQKESRDMKRL